MASKILDCLGLHSRPPPIAPQCRTPRRMPSIEFNAETICSIEVWNNSMSIAAVSF